VSLFPATTPPPTHTHIAVSLQISISIMNFTPTGMIYIKVVVITLQIIMYDEKFMEELNFDVRSVLSTFYA